MNSNKIVSKYRSFSSAGKAAIWFTICNYILKGVSLITVPIFTRLLIPEEYGLLAELTAAEEIILMLSNWDISAGAYLKGLFKYEDISFFTSVAQLFANIATIGVYTILLFAIGISNRTNGFTSVTIVFMFLQHFFYPSYRLWLTAQQRNFSYKAATIGTMLYGLIVSVMPLIFVVLIDQTAEIKFCTTMGASAIFCLPFYIKNIRYKGIWKERERVLGQLAFIIKYQSPFLISSLSLVLLTQFDRIIISRLVGHEQTAYYGVACSITSVLSILYSSIGQAFIPWKYKKLKSNRYSDIKRIENGLIICAGGVTFLFVCVAPEMMGLLFTEAYYEAVLCIPPLAIGAFFNFFSSVFASIESFFEKTKYSAYGMILSSGLNILLNFLLIGKYGYMICAYTTAFSYLVYSIAHWAFAQMTLRQAKISDSLYDNRWLAMNGIGVLFLTALMVFLYPYPAFRYVLIVIILFIFIWKRDWIIHIFGVNHNA